MLYMQKSELALSLMLACLISFTPNFDRFESLSRWNMQICLGFNHLADDLKLY